MKELTEKEREEYRNAKFEYESGPYTGSYLVVRVFICSECGDECKRVEETFDYSGTHCNNGISGTHHTGVYVSDCCSSEYHEAEDEGNQPLEDQKKSD